MALCEVALSDGSDLLAEDMKFVLGWNSISTSTTVAITRMAYWKFNCVIVNLDKTQRGIYKIQNFIISIIFVHNRS